MSIDKKFIDQFINVTSKAALASSYLVGKKDKIAADKAAVDSMRSELNKINFEGEIVIGEGELDEAPMLYIGEKIGTNEGPKFDIVRAQNKLWTSSQLIMNLNKNTALLPLINLKKNQKHYGKNTKEALNAGFVWGYEGLINNIIDKIISKEKNKYKIILTGGYASFFKRIIKKKISIDQDITIKGITKVYKEFI